MLIEESYPLSPLQHAMLVHNLAAPESGVYIQQLVSVLREELNVSAFHSSWEKLVSRHAVLRTSFSWKDTEEPYRRVHRYVLLPFRELYWSDRADQEADLENFLQTDRQLGFQLDKPPLMRLILIRCARAD